MRDDPRVVLYHPVPNDQLLFDAACKWAYRKLSEHTGSPVPPATVFCYEQASLEGLTERANAFYTRGNIGISRRTFEKIAAVKDKDSLECVLRRGALPEEIYPYDLAIYAVGTFVHEFAHAFFDAGIAENVLSALRAGKTPVRRFDSRVRTIGEAFAFSAQKKITGLFSFSHDMADSYAGNLDVQLLITYYVNINKKVRNIPVGRALLEVVRERGLAADPSLTLPSRSHISVVNGYLRQSSLRPRNNQ